MKNKIAWHIRQGDVLVSQVNHIPEGAKKKPRENGRVVLAYGEATGHHHSLTEKGADLYEFEGATYLEISEALALLTHQEHDTIRLPAGKYRVTIQREYTPAGIRNVMD